MLPRIGITGSVAPSRIGTRRTFLNEPYVVGIREAGGLPLVVTPAHADDSLRELYELLDGLVLSGGEDVEPARYGEAVAHPGVESVPERDAMEFRLLEWALADGLPVLAICRGIQVLNVALGGSLYQDLPAEHAHDVRHDQTRAEPPVARARPSHAVTVRTGSFLGGLVGEGELQVNSMHHQGIKALASALCPVGYAADGLIEAVEANEPVASGFLVGVQWHPEELALTGEDPASRRLFEAFVAAAAKQQRR
ncbi:MAG TPA: gamma-glutamyl-gamma-aminobutyrate hydrolase family protein [Methylomirabilota bacterium]|nr:gamma-glutamyl-gamma-aminobutyrate hydrolase family protein [Methylomirabilota bacterium]